ncbi:RNA-directed DNA polymerase from mobile element jockey-like protein [Elysia marginata]|uniref:RNA-directed DNA polymerase from mobile element jockey-like protein n=1 Tax=Elysia marginata TaxID=1093978 RepID=A0AAV4F2V0_9GAST|nr:RNA-directed DNA polymerase from mobile element jockey-like protein [Elysia marginata]
MKRYKQTVSPADNACRIVTGQLRPTPLPLLYRTAGIAPPDIRRQTYGSTEKHKQETDLRHPLFDHSYLRARLKSRKSFRTVESVQATHVVTALGKQFIQTFLSPPTCKIGTWL